MFADKYNRKKERRDLNPRVLNHAKGVYGIRNLLRYGIDCKAIVWNQAAENAPSVMPYAYGDTIHADA